MKKRIAYLIYFVVTIAISYAFQWILVLFIGSLRFTAADRPPGDITLTGKMLFSMGVPLFYFLCLTFVFFLYRYLWKFFRVELQKVFPIIFNITVALYLIFCFSVAVFDL